jgi:hypothetical protein
MAMRPAELLHWLVDRLGRPIASVRRPATDRTTVTGG